MPIAWFQVYLWGTVFLFACGPWPWPVRNAQMLYTFLALAHTALLLGYLRGARVRLRRRACRWAWPKLFAASLAANLVLIGPTLVFRTGALVPSAATALSDLGGAYKKTNELRATGTPLAEYGRIAAAPVLSWLMPLTIYFWKRLGVIRRVLATGTIAITLYVWIVLGTNKGLADAVLVVPAVLVASYLSGRSIVRRCRLVAGAILVVAMVIGFFAFFSAAIVSRLGGESAVDTFAPLGIEATEDNWALRLVPAAAVPGVKSLLTYTGQGYYALALALDEPFVPTWGVGHSFATIRQAERVLGEGRVSSRTYPFRLEERGWDAWGLWASIYPWIASDVGFAGSLVVVAWIGYGMARAWREAIDTHNPLAVCMCAQFVIMVSYFPANNQVFQTLEPAAAFVGTALLWRFARSPRLRRTR